MNSKEVTPFIDKEAMQRENGDRMIEASTAYTAVELAGQGAGERMRAKAIGAFDGMWFENGEDGEVKADYEYQRRNFKRKLNKEDEVQEA